VQPAVGAIDGRCPNHAGGSFEVGLLGAKLALDTLALLLWDRGRLVDLPAGCTVDASAGDDDGGPSPGECWCHAGAGLAIRREGDDHVGVIVAKRADDGLVEGGVLPYVESLGL
jgi:hypothetical protein